MSDIDLTEAVEAAAAAINSLWPDAGSVDPDPESTYREDAYVALTAALPHIARQVREQVARDLLAVNPAEWALAGQRAGEDAARIARGDS